MQQLKSELQGQAEVIKIDVDKHGELAARYGVRSIPTFIAFRDGREIARAAGALSKDELRSMVLP